MNGRDMMPACARIAAADPAMADRMWNTTTDDDGRDLVDERMRGKGRMLCAACPMRLDCISRALVNGWKDKAVYGGLDYASRWTLARLIARDLHIADGGLHRIPRSRVRDWLAEHPDWAERMRRDVRDYWRRAKRRQRSRRRDSRRGDKNAEAGEDIHARHHGARRAGIVLLAHFQRELHRRAH